MPHEPNTEWGVEQLRNAVKAAGVALWSWNDDDDAFLMDPKSYELWDVENGRTLTLEQLSAKIHPANRDRVCLNAGGHRSVRSRPPYTYRGSRRPVGIRERPGR